mmetsp:Transcript_9892/g.60309  ORF Transcript_9892/g.60309 Transcript_9892/m.60309 type:complete len:142 (-) Transcript_9892:622-1047(-)
MVLDTFSRVFEPRGPPPHLPASSPASSPIVSMLPMHMSTCLNLAPVPFPSAETQFPPLGNAFSCTRRLQRSHFVVQSWREWCREDGVDVQLEKWGDPNVSERTGKEHHGEGNAARGRNGREGSNGWTKVDGRRQMEAVGGV